MKEKAFFKKERAFIESLRREMSDLGLFKSSYCLKHLKTEEEVFLSSIDGVVVWLKK